jgi:hypothetical protein
MSSGINVRRAYGRLVARSHGGAIRRVERHPRQAGQRRAVPEAEGRAGVRRKGKKQSIAYVVSGDGVKAVRFWIENFATGRYFNGQVWQKRKSRRGTPATTPHARSSLSGSDGAGSIR